MANRDLTTDAIARTRTSINLHGCSCSGAPRSDGRGFDWRTEPEGGNPSSGTAETSAEAWEKAVGWAHAAANTKARDLATWDAAADYDLEASPEMQSQPGLYTALNRAWLGAKGLEGVLRVLRANGRHEEWFADGPEQEGAPLNPYVVGGLEDAAKFLADGIRESIETAAAWKPHRA